MRHKKTEKRKTEPDLIYKNKLVAKFINGLMRDGKKTVAQNLLYETFELISKQDKEPVTVFEKAIQNVGPRVEVKSRRVGGASYQVPVDIRTTRRLALTFRWIISYARKRAEKTMEERLGGEIIDASNNTGASVKKKEDTHKMAEANRAFAHYRW